MKQLITIPAADLADMPIEEVRAIFDLPPIEPHMTYAPTGDLTSPEMGAQTEVRTAKILLPDLPE